MFDENTALDLGERPVEDKPGVKLPDGEPCYFLLQEDMGPGEVAQMTRLQRDLKMLKTRIEKDANSSQVDKNAREMDALYRKFVRFVLPELPETVLEGLKTGKLIQIVMAWTRFNSPNPTGGSQPVS